MIMYDYIFQINLSLSKIIKKNTMKIYLFWDDLALQLTVNSESLVLFYLSHFTTSPFWPSPLG